MKRQRILMLLLLPCLLYLGVFFFTPIVGVLLRSLFSPNLTLENYVRIITEPVYGQILLNTIKIASITCLFCLAIGYPFAYFLTRVSGKIQTILLLTIVLPFWTSILVRSYAWLVLLQKEGIVNRILLEVGAADQPFKLVYNLVGVILGMSYVLLPFMVLALYGSMRTIDTRLLLVAKTLGASPDLAFLKIYLPLSIPGISAGSVLVFVLGMGYFITPALLGGRTETTISMLIDTQMNNTLDWGMGSALSVTLFAIVTGLLALMGKALGFGKIINRPYR